MYFEPFSISGLALRWGQLITIALSFFLLIVPIYLRAQGTTDSLEDLQRQWDTIQFQTPKSQREEAFQTLASKAEQSTLSHSNNPDYLLWQGIILSSWAGEKGGLGALGLVKQAKQLYERVIELKPTTLNGSAFSSLGVLYYKVPGWPLGFGDKAKAGDLLRRALEINPVSVDANYFYADYLFEQGDLQQAKLYAERSLQAPKRTGREVADQGRKAETATLLNKIGQK